MNKVLLICSGGGHFREMEILLEQFPSEHTYIIASNRKFIESNPRVSANIYLVNPHNSLYLYLLNMISSLYIVLRYRPNISISTGAGICIFPLIFSKMLGIRSIYVESFCKINELSRTGKFVLNLVDEFYVHHASLRKLSNKIRLGNFV